MFYFRIKTNAENATISINGTSGITYLKMEEPGLIDTVVSNMYGTKTNSTYVSDNTILFVDFSDLQSQSGDSGKTPIPQPTDLTKDLFLSNDGQNLVWREAQDIQMINQQLKRLVILNQEPLSTTKQWIQCGRSSFMLMFHRSLNLKQILNQHFYIMVRKLMVLACLLKLHHVQIKFNPWNSF